MTTTASEPLDAAPRPVWTPPAGGYWEGEWKDGRHATTVRDPEDGTPVGRVMDATDEEADRAVAHLAERWRRRAWPLWERRDALDRAAASLADAAERFAAILAAESCKTITEARAEVHRAVETLRLSAHAASGLAGRTVPFAGTPRGQGWTGWYTRELIGVVAAITPFNDPLNLVAHKLGPALVAGCPVVLKPAPQTPLSALALVDLLLTAGVPGEYLAAVPGERAGAALTRNPRVDVVSFTGGPRTADRIARGGPARKLLMELGGNNALIVCEDADPARAARAVAGGARLHTGGERRGTFVTPAVLTGVPGRARLRTEEVFGPVVLLDPFTTLAEAVASANAVDTGLQAGVLTRDIQHAMAIADVLTVGAVLINSSPDFRIDAMPFGGFKRSGIGREGVEAAIDELTEPKIVAINRDEAVGTISP